MRKAGASTPASPEHPTITTVADQPSSGPGPASLSCRSAATGVEAEFLREAGARLETVTCVLTAAALGHVDPGQLTDSLPPLIAVLDDAAKFVAQAGEP